MKAMKASGGDWLAFEQWVDYLRANYGKKSSSPLLFRGQGNSEWPLTTTLERSGQPGMLFREFYELITAAIGPAVETFTGVSVPEYDPEFCKRFSTMNCFCPAPAVFLLFLSIDTWFISDIMVSRPLFSTGLIRRTLQPFLP